MVCLLKSRQRDYVRFEVFTAVSMKNAAFWDVSCVALVRTDILAERSASIIRVRRSGELGTLAVTSKQRTKRICISNVGATFLRNASSYKSHTA
jgi:hypothetical protein